MTLGTCPTGKRRFRDARGATHFMQSMQARAAHAEEHGGQHNYRVVRKYQCPECDGWHLTSKEEWA